MTPRIKPTARPAFRWAVISALTSASCLSTHADESPALASTNHATFAALTHLGVTTIISVDGSKPDVEADRKHGLPYVHLLFGYDGVPTNRIVELVKAAATQPGPISVPCHHGLQKRVAH